MKKHLITRLSEEDESDLSQHSFWLDMLFNVIVALALAELAHQLNRDLSVAGVIKFILLFIPVWWTWVGEAYFSARFQVHDNLQTFLTLIKLMAISIMTISIKTHFATQGIFFALAYAGLRFLLSASYLLAYLKVPSSRSFTFNYIIGFLVAGLLWLVSIFFASPFRYVLWGIAIFVDLVTPATLGNKMSHFSLKMKGLSNRFAGFMAIIVGSAVTAIVGTVADKPDAVYRYVPILTGFSMLFGFCWLYYDYIHDHIIQVVGMGSSPQKRYLRWLWTHLLLVMGLLSTGVCIQHVINSNQSVPLSDMERLLFCLSVAGVLTALDFINNREDHPHTYPWWSFHWITGALFIIFPGLFGSMLLPQQVILFIFIVSPLQSFAILNFRKSQSKVSEKSQLISE